MKLGIGRMSPDSLHLGRDYRKRVDLDHVELFHLIVWKLYQAVAIAHAFFQHVNEFAEGFHAH